MRKKNASPLANIRRARTLSQADLANLSKLSQQTISKAERGLLPLSKDVQELIATILGVSRQEAFPEPTAQEQVAS
jgi:transcriptional regulator with XRE-family HTH domain